MMELLLTPRKLPRLLHPRRRKRRRSLLRVDQLPRRKKPRLKDLDKKQRRLRGKDSKKSKGTLTRPVN